MCVIAVKFIEIFDWEVKSQNRGLNGLLDFTDFNFTNQQISLCSAST
jgi:hypothetical protein